MLNKIFNSLIPPSGGTRFPALDGLRGLACLTVVLGHWGAFAPIEFNIKNNIGPFSQVAVAIFFALSAFLLYYPYAVGKKVNTWNYYKRRFWRIYPAYIPALALGIVAWHFLNKDTSLINIITHVTFTHSLFGFDREIIPPAWSLAIEVQFYIVLPLIAFTLRKRFALKTILVVIAVIFFDQTPFIKHFIASLSPPAFALKFIGGINLPRMFLPFIAGIVAAHVVAAKPGFSHLPLGLPAVLTLSALTASLLPFANQTFYALHYDFPFNQYGLIISILLCIVIYSNALYASKILSCKLIRLLGICSYGMFLFHVPMFWILLKIFNKNTVYHFGIPLTLIAGLLSYMFIEAPAIRFGRNLNLSKILAKYDFFTQKTEPSESQRSS